MVYGLFRRETRKFLIIILQETSFISLLVMLLSDPGFISLSKMKVKIIYLVMMPLYLFCRIRHDCKECIEASEIVFYINFRSVLVCEKCNYVFRVIRFVIFHKWPNYFHKFEFRLRIDLAVYFFQKLLSSGQVFFCFLLGHVVRMCVSCMWLHGLAPATKIKVQ